MADKKVAFGATAGIAAAVAAILGAVYHDEGGYVNHPSDPGGETNMGITKRVAQEAGWEGTMRLFPKQCEKESDVCADRIYFEEYMLKPGYVPIIVADHAVGEELVNSAVNFGIPRPSRWLQLSINEVCPASKLVIDGRVGQGTAAAFLACQAKVTKTKFCLTMLDKMDGKQRQEYDRLVKVNPKLKVFHKGWVNNRIGNVDRKKCQA